MFKENVTLKAKISVSLYLFLMLCLVVLSVTVVISFGLFVKEAQIEADRLFKQDLADLPRVFGVTVLEKNEQSYSDIEKLTRNIDSERIRIKLLGEAQQLMNQGQKISQLHLVDERTDPVLRFSEISAAEKEMLIRKQEFAYHIRLAGIFNSSSSIYATISQWLEYKQTTRWPEIIEMLKIKTAPPGRLSFL